MIDKIIKYIKSTKFLNLFCYIFSAIYFIFVLCFTLNGIFVFDYKDKEYNSMVSGVNKINQKANQDDFFQKQEEEIETVEPIFSDGKTAFLTAYNNTMSANSLYAEANGNSTVVVNVLGQQIQIKVAMLYKVVKFDDDKLYDSRNIILKSASSMESTVREMSNSATKYLKQSNTIHYYESGDVYFDENKVICGNFENCKKKRNDKSIMLAENFYEINENSISEICDFVVRKDKKGVPYYVVKIKINTNEACKNFGKILQFSAGSPEFPTFTEASVLTATIDNNGYMIKLSTEDCVVVKKPALGQLVPCPMRTTMTYVFSSINEEINYELEGF